jgi:hypothetical protein
VDELLSGFPQRYPCSRRCFPDDGSQLRPLRSTKTALIDFSRPICFLRGFDGRRPLSAASRTTWWVLTDIDLTTSRFDGLRQAKRRRCGRMLALSLDMAFTRDMAFIRTDTGRPTAPAGDLGWNRRRSPDCCHLGDRRLTLRNPRSLLNLFGFPSTSLICHEKDIPTEGTPQKASPRIPPSHAHPRRTCDDQESSSKGPEATRCLAINRSVTLEIFVESCLTGNVAARAGWSWSARQARMGLPDWGSWCQGVAVQPLDATASRDDCAPRRRTSNCNQELTT